MGASSTAFVSAALLFFGAMSAANMIGRAASDFGIARLSAFLTGAVCLGASLWSSLALADRLTDASMSGLSYFAAAVFGAGLTLAIVYEAVDGETKRNRTVAWFGLGALGLLVLGVHAIATASQASEHPAAVLLRLGAISGAGVLGVRLAFKHRRLSHLFVAAIGVFACVVAELTIESGAAAHSSADIETHSILAPNLAGQDAIYAAAMIVGAVSVMIGLSTFAAADVSLALQFVGGAPLERPRSAPAPSFSGAGAGASATLRAQEEIELAMAEALDRALDRKEIDIDLQPQRRLSDGVLVGAEALARWRRGPEAGARPDQFVAAAERFGVIDKLGEYVLRNACKAATEWPKTLHVAVNVSPLQLQNPAFESMVRQVLEETGLSPRRLELEITESAFVDLDEFDPEVVQRLRAKGVAVSIDDFGRGYSGLSRLHDLKVDMIKLDRSVASQVACSDKAQAIVRSVVDLAREIGVKVLAEGVETVEDLDFHRRLGCDFVQGFGIGKPMPQDDFPSAAPPWPL